jgi:thiol-disulfide isomerase/thioredoxin
MVLPYALAVLAGLLGAPARTRAELVVDKLNKKIDNFTLRDADGRAVSLYDLKDKQAIVIVFLSFECPVSNSYAPALAELAHSYGERQVAFLAVNSSDDGDANQLAKRAAEFKMPSRYSRTSTSGLPTPSRPTPCRQLSFSIITSCFATVAGSTMAMLPA